MSLQCNLLEDMSSLNQSTSRLRRVYMSEDSDNNVGWFWVLFTNENRERGYSSMDERMGYG